MSFLSNLLEELYKHDREKSNSLSKEKINELYRKLTTEHKDIYKKLASK